MFIKLKWVNLNSQPVTTRIYRNDTPVTNDLLGTPLVELINGEVEWVDNNVVRNATYYYTFETIGANETVYSKPLEVQAVPRSGPGPQELQFGDMSYGYFGQVPSSMLFSGPELKAAVGLTVGTEIVASPMWDKWARNGKICYFPRRALFYRVRWSELYNLGLVYGVDGPGPQNLGTPVNQLKIVEKGLDRFIVRLPTGIDDRNNPDRLIPADASNTTIQAYREYSEVADFLYPLAIFAPRAQRAINIAQLAGGELGLNSGAAGSFSYSQELNAAKTQTMCLRVNNSADNRGIWEQYSVINLTDANQSWWPVLELVDNVEVSTGV
jgi:hypothetical protein